MIRDIIIKVHYVIDDDSLKQSGVRITTPMRVKEMVKEDLEIIFADDEGYRGMEITVDDSEII